VRAREVLELVRQNLIHRRLVPPRQVVEHGRRRDAAGPAGEDAGATCKSGGPREPPDKLRT